MVGIQLSYWVSAYLQGRTVSFREGIPWIYPPPRIPVTNEGFFRDPLLKMLCHPGGDWHPGWGVDLSYTHQLPLHLRQSAHLIALFLEIGISSLDDA